MRTAGTLKHSITIQVRTASRGTTGGVEYTWATYIKTRASIEPLMGREYHAAMQDIGENKIRFRVRYDSSVAAMNVHDYRISYNSNTYDIESIVNVGERNREVTIMTKLNNG